MFAKLHPRRSLDSFSCLTSTPRPQSPNSHGIISFADPHPQTHLESYRLKNVGGRGCSQLSRLGTPKIPSRMYLSFQSLAQCPSRNSFLLITIQFNGGGVGVSWLTRHPTKGVCPRRRALFASPDSSGPSRAEGSLPVPIRESVLSSPPRQTPEGAYFFLPCGRMEGHRAKTEVVRPPRGVNSPRTTHHSGLTAATMSRSILLTAFS